jgi:hypothetical protein
MEMELYITKQLRKLFMENFLMDTYQDLDNFILIKEILMLGSLEMIRKRVVEFIDGLI